MHLGAPLELALRILHVLLAVAWTGVSIALNLLVMPVLGKVSAVARGEVATRLTPASIRLTNVLGGFALLTGLALLYIRRDGLDFSGLSGRLLLFGLLLALAVLYLVNAALRPTFKAIQKATGELRPNEEPPAGLRFLQTRMAYLAGLMLVLLVAVVVAMVVSAHYA